MAKYLLRAVVCLFFWPFRALPLLVFLYTFYQVVPSSDINRYSFRIAAKFSSTLVSSLSIFFHFGCMNLAFMLHCSCLLAYSRKTVWSLRLDAFITLCLKKIPVAHAIRALITGFVEEICKSKFSARAEPSLMIFRALILQFFRKCLRLRTISFQWCPRWPIKALRSSRFWTFSYSSSCTKVLIIMILLMCALALNRALLLEPE